MELILKNQKVIKYEESYCYDGVQINVTSETTPEEKEEIAKQLKSERYLVSLRFQGKKYRSVKHNIA